MTALERISKASYEANDICPPWSPDDWGWQATYVKRSRAMLEALKLEAIPLAMRVTGNLDVNIEADLFTAMIDAALSDAKT